MLFASPLFLFLFLPLVLAGYFVVPAYIKNAFLITVSLFFYAWGDLNHLLFFLLLITLNYIGGRILEMSSHYKKMMLLSIICIDIGFLLYYKYIIFFISIINKIAVAVSLTPFKPPAIVLPLGISFITFRLVSYMVDIYCRKTQAEKNFFHFLLYASFFPLLIAGPISRYIDLKQQLHKRSITVDLFSQGVGRFVYGLGKKVLFANNMGAVTDTILQLPPSDLTPPLVWLAMISYMLQIYFDFSGYSDMAIGLGNMFGFTIPENFNYPYISTSIKEFWQRWHISLSSWFRDYVYIPLGGSRKGTLMTCVIILTVFFLTGFWHGASFHFIVWGVYFGIFLIIEKVFNRYLTRMWLPLQHIYTLGILLFGWVLFRADTVYQSFFLLKTMSGMITTPSSFISIMPFLNAKYITILVAGIMGATPLIPQLKNRYPAAASLLSPLAILLILICSLLQLAGETYSPFIYFQF